jgi:NTF2 fold immunity protein
MSNLSKKLVIVVLVALPLASACTQKKAVPSVAKQNENQTSVNANAVQQDSPASKPKPTQLDSQHSSNNPKNDYVPDERTAIAIAVAVWIPIYGREKIESEKPYKATLKNGIWTVTGTLPEGYDGGTAVAEIAQNDGRILRVIHYQ